MSILVHAAISHFGKSKLPFDDAELMFHLGSDSGFVPIPGALVLGQLPVAAALGLGEILGSWRVVGNSLPLAGVRGITPYSGLFSMKQIRENLGVVYVGRSSDHRVDKLRTAVDADVMVHI